MGKSVVEKRREAGRELRHHLPRGAHGQVPSFDRDAVALLEAGNEGRVPELVPIRYGRMLQSPFAFYRGSAALMAFDLATVGSSELDVQLCGDCHMMNFGTYGTPERNLVFDITDFDETLPGPFEWDVKRLATSLVIGARSKGFPVSEQADVTSAMVRTYRERLWAYSDMTPLDVWYARIGAEDVLKCRGACRKMVDTARLHNSASLIPRLVDGDRLKDDPPLVYHLPDPPDLTEFMAAYRESLQDNRGELMSRYRLVDVAMKVVGVGSVGTRCLAVLMMSPEGQPLILQLKEAAESVLARYVGRSRYTHQGRRVVEGQRLMQAATDVFLGWGRSDRFGRDFYVRQLRDWKGALDMDEVRGPADLQSHAELCGQALARAHARAGGRAAELSGYLGKRDSFDRAVLAFAKACADQYERDYEALKAAWKAGRIKVER
ncbi:MAG TPA: DUF2252 domain-containing protein [Candidatus Xenobia bacterium]|jgi:uncharacterized protein (DUF2252 family)